MLWGADGKWSGCGSLADERIPGIFTVFASLEMHREAAFQAPACWGLKKFVCVCVVWGIFFLVVFFFFFFSFLFKSPVFEVSLVNSTRSRQACSLRGREGQGCWREASFKWVVKDFLRILESRWPCWAVLGRSCYVC